MIWGYARVSTKTQKLERQVRNIKAEYPSAVVVQEAYTGTKMNRPEWGKLVKKLKAGDTVVFDSVSRMSRNAEEGMAVYEQLYTAGISLVFLKEPHINTAVYQEAAQRRLELEVETGRAVTDEILTGMVDLINRVLLALAKEQIRLAFGQAEKEVQDLRQRTVEGIRSVKEANEYYIAIGQPENVKQIGQGQGKKLTVKKSLKAKDQIRRYSKTFGGPLADPECIKLVGVSRNSFYKYKREILEEGNL